MRSCKLFLLAVTADVTNVKSKCSIVSLTALAMFWKCIFDISALKKPSHFNEISHFNFK